MKTLKTIIAVACAGSILLTACSKSDGTASSGSDNPSAAGGKRETIEIYSYSPNASASLPAGDEDFVKKVIDEKFNVDLKLSHNIVEGADRYNKLNVRLSSNDSPDLLITSGLRSLEYKNNNMLVPLNKYVTQEKMPNYFKWYTPDVVLKRYSLDKTKPEIHRIPVPVLSKSAVSWYVRQDWLDKLGLKVPANLDEFMKVSRAFTNDDPDGNGKKDTFGFSVSANGDGITIDWPQFYAHGFEGSLYVKDNKLVHYKMDYRNDAVLRDINKMIKEGSVDPDWFLQKGTAHIDKAIQGRVGIIRDYTGKFGLESVPGSGASKSKEINPNAKWTAFNAIDGKSSWQENLPSMGFAVTKIAEKNPAKVEKAFKIIDFLSSEEGFLLTRYGKEGVHYTKKGNVVTLNPDNIKRDIESKNNWLSIYQVFTADEPQKLGLEVIDPRMTDRDRETLKKIESYPMASSIGTNVSPPPGVDLVAQDRLMNETMAKIALGEMQADQWKAVLDKVMNEMGGKSLLDAYTQQIKEAGVIK
ncbi:MAG: transporter substrate-binding protein [Paenibacillus sp.]|jgi:ABC-type glycerol-3-phosphate transport system substrate-binding protein|nr:transporter substrate-binding protein [Paenibacillus sp.]